jgi:hypothetical protein
MQTIRNFGGSLGLAVLGTILILQNKSNIEASLSGLGIPKARADAIADALSQSGGGDPSGSFGDATGRAAQRAFEAVQHDFAMSTRTVFYVMAGVLAVTCVVAHIAMPRDRVEVETEAEPAAAEA